MIEPASPLPRREMALLTAVAIVALAVVAHFFDRFWSPADEGVYAYVAERVLAGDVLYRDVQDLHAGYIQLVNAAAFALFGTDLISLRYPLALATVVQAVLVFLLLRPRGAVIAASGGLAAAALTFVQFLNPTANWYALFVAVIAITVLASSSRSTSRLVAIGFLLGMLFLLRQLTGVLFAMGVLTFLLLEAAAATPARSDRALLARVLVAVMMLGLAGYLVARVELFAAVLYGIWPLLILARVLTHVRPPDAAVARLAGCLLAGALLAAMPLALYLGWHGALDDWLRDSFLTASRLTGLEFISMPGYRDLLGMALANMLHPARFGAAANGLFWACLVVAPALVGVLSVRCVRRATASRLPVHPLVVTVPFFALVSVHYQIPIYLLFSAAPLLWALLWLAGEWPRAARAGVAGLVVTLCAVGLLWQAGQPLSRGWAGIAAGRMVAAEAGAGLPKASLRIDTSDHETYRRLLSAIDRHAGLARGLLAVPVNPELYFLSGRRPPVRFFSTALGLHSTEDLHAAIAALRADPPAVIVHLPKDKYNTPLGDALLHAVLGEYERVDTVGDFEVWALSPRLASIPAAALPAAP